MKYLFPVAIAILLTIAPCYADTQGNQFRHAFACPDRGRLSVCIFGTIASGTPVTVVANDWKSAAVPKERFKDVIENGAKTITRLEVTKPPPAKTSLIAVLIAAEAVEVLPLKEVHDEAVVRRINLFLEDEKRLNTAALFRDGAKTYLLRLSPTVLLSETFFSPGGEAENANKITIGCGYCEVVPLLVGPDLTDLFADIRFPEMCGGIVSAFAVSGRIHLMSHAESCESDSYSAFLVHDLSGKRPRLVFK
jgi:hypothetical protein